ncbi:ABC transporter substrate-binding protein [Gemella cuniculi]|uniref:ABC transporter substrate-binding protein n=1 Tax=Gemella cuniculi TaxID=150240 RepID=UPI00042A5F02|nr:ABC transporter substrate-binding protein [Gemella cuniculi]
MKKIFKYITVLLSAVLIILGVTACSTNKEQKNTDSQTQQVQDLSYDQLKEKANGTTVNFYGYGGSELTNNWVDNELAPMVQKNYNIKVNRVGMNIDEVLNLMLNEDKAGKKDEGSVDLIWINGENFYTAKKNNLLFGPFANKLPNYKKYIDANSDDVKMDFGYPTEFYEVPYGKAQFVMIYNSDRVKDVPTNLTKLKEYVKAHPGRFTYATMPDFTSSAFIRNVISEIVGYEQFMTMDADYETVKKAVQPAMDYLKEIKPYLWNQGKTYPADTPALDNMYKDGEVDFTMSYNPNSASANIEKGKFPQSTKTFLFDKGTTGNTHFVAISKNSKNKAGAMLVANQIISAEAQISKYNPSIWGDMPVFDIDKLSSSEKEKLDGVKLGVATIPQSELVKKRIPEMPAKLVPIIEKIWEEEVLNAK